MKTTNSKLKINSSDIEEKSCDYCGALFYNDNPRSIYCSDSCKTRMYVKRKNSRVDYGKNLTDISTNEQRFTPANTIEKEGQQDIPNMQNQPHLSASQQKITEKESLLTTGVIADKWLRKIYGEKIRVVSFSVIEKHCGPLAEILINDIENCENLSEHGFKTSNFTLQCIVDNKGYIVGGDNENKYSLTKTKNK